MGPVPISIAAQAEPPHLMWEASVVTLIVGWGTSVGFPSAGILGGSTSEKEANRRGQGDPSG